MIYHIIKFDQNLKQQKLSLNFKNSFEEYLLKKQRELKQGELCINLRQSWLIVNLFSSVKNVNTTNQKQREKLRDKDITREDLFLMEKIIQLKAKLSELRKKLEEKITVQKQQLAITESREEEEQDQVDVEEQKQLSDKKSSSQISSFQQDQPSQKKNKYEMDVLRGTKNIFTIPLESASENTIPHLTNVVKINEQFSMLEVGMYPKDWIFAQLDGFSQFSYMYFYKYYFDQLFLNKELIQLIDGEYEKLKNHQDLNPKFYQLFNSYFSENSWREIVNKIKTKESFFQVIMDYFENQAHAYASAQYASFTQLIQNEPNSQQAKCFIQTIETIMRTNDFLLQGSDALGFSKIIHNYSNSFQKHYVVGSNEQIANLLITKQSILQERMNTSQQAMKGFFNPQEIMKEYYDMQEERLRLEDELSQRQKKLLQEQEELLPVQTSLKGQTSLQRKDLLEITYPTLVQSQMKILPQSQNDLDSSNIIQQIKRSKESIQVVQVGQCYYSNDEKNIYNIGVVININNPKIFKMLLPNKDSWKNIHLVSATKQEKILFVNCVKDYFNNPNTFKQYDCEKIFYRSEMDDQKFTSLMNNSVSCEEEQNGVLIRKYEGEKIIIIKDSTLKRKGMILKLENNIQEKQKFDQAKFPDFKSLLSNCVNKNTSINQIKELTDPTKIMKLTYAKVIDYHNLFSVTDSLISKQEMNNFENQKNMPEEQFYQQFDKMEDQLLTKEQIQQELSIQQEEEKEEEERKEGKKEQIVERQTINKAKLQNQPQIVGNKTIRTKEISAINDFSNKLNCCYLAEPIVNAFKQMSTGLLLENKYVFYFGLKKLITKIIGSVCPPIESKNHTKSKDFKNFTEFIRAVFFGNTSQRQKEINATEIDKLRSVLIQQSRTALRLFSQLYGVEINNYLCKQIFECLQYSQIDTYTKKHYDRLQLSGINTVWKELFSVKEKDVELFNKTYAKLLIYTNVVAQMCNKSQNDENNQAFLSEYSQRMIKKLSLILFPHRRSNRKMNNIDLVQFFIISADIFALLQGFNNIREIFYEQAKMLEDKEFKKMLKRGQMLPIRINKYFYLSMFSKFKIKLIDGENYQFPLIDGKPERDPKYRKLLKNQSHSQSQQSEQSQQSQQSQSKSNVGKFDLTKIIGPNKTGKFSSNNPNANFRNNKKN
ncbi:hypothetical protein TTHERM_01295370 (macronuclear) [Tetrahymena thermophila SB210]|uniref:Uncharacterized protein n=1 Tax=Tetrahymena thermophila (strain SB210) TaxID=312017 RepID=Q23VA8_TETTS|nr:hypothetical protein TTHERM_01295370 [Tetrahymena thermophila SB210]EAS00474.2 hypothetical protein TTHERM_01295370 [Tetrahymena thermophila SB210]|eukprot:XP_001020719.2 hypothetical protein TTHERM_01295370 [Tetrahymena thermophila SB210]